MLGKVLICRSGVTATCTIYTQVYRLVLVFVVEYVDGVPDWLVTLTYLPVPGNLLASF